MRNIILTIVTLASFQVLAQNSGGNLFDTTAVDKAGANALTLGAYAQIDYNQPIGGDTRGNGKLDVHRMVTTLAYRFNSRARFFTEIEYEHVKEVFVEQAYLSYRLGNQISLKAGLMLIPMGIINEYHEPPTFNGVERPNVDKNIVPTTWREVGIGINGRLEEAALKYQLYIVNGFNGYDGGGKFRGKDGLRKGRQKGAESFISSANFSGKLDYYGISGLKLGLAGYFGKSQSTLYNGLDESNNPNVATADSSVIDIGMIGLDARYNSGGLQLRGQYIFSILDNTDQYNAFTGMDLGSSMSGFYLEAGFDLLNGQNKEEKVVPFVRFEKYNTHQDTEGGLPENNKYDISEFIIGVGWKVATGAVFKADLQFIKSEADDKAKKQFNMGVGIWF